MTTDTLEPRTRTDLGLSLLSSAAIGLAAMTMLGLPLAAVYLVWLMPAMEFAVMVGVLVVGLEIMCGFVIARLTRDDRGIGARLAEGDAAIAELAGVTADRDKWRKIAEGAQPVVLPARDDAKFVAPKVRDAAWTDASDLLVMCAGDFGAIPGRRDTRMTQAAWEAAVAVLAGINTLARRNRRYELVMTVAEARQRLDEIQ